MTFVEARSLDRRTRSEVEATCWWTAPYVALLLSVLFLQCLVAIREKSATFDEPTYIASGYLYLTRGMFDINPEAPPLMKYLVALPLLFLDLLPPEQVAHWNGGAVHQYQYQYNTSFLFENRVGADTILLAARCPVAVVSVLLGYLVWSWTRQLSGPRAGAVALALYCFCPNILAHSSLATLDLGVTAGCFATAYCFWRLYRRPALWSCVWAGAALAAGLLAKNSAILILFVIPLLLAAAVARQYQSENVLVAAAKGGERLSRFPGSRALVVATAASLLIAAILVACAYGFLRFGLFQYLSGAILVVFQRDLLTHRTYQQFCWGQYSVDGFRWYFLAALLLKTPIPTLLLTAATAAVLMVRRPRRIFDELFLVLPIAAFLLATVPLRDNLGLRYVLPVYPFLYVLIGGMTAEVWDRIVASSPPRGTRRRIVKTSGALLASWYIGSALWIAPSYLAYFNEFAGGPANGIRYLDDSNIDWGQDLKGLARYLREHGIPHVKLFYVVGYLEEPATRYYGIQTERITVEEIRKPRQGWYAVSAHILQRPVVAQGPGHTAVRFDWLDRFTPVARIGYSIYLYRFE